MVGLVLRIAEILGDVRDRQVELAEELKVLSATVASGSAGGGGDGQYQAVGHILYAAIIKFIKYGYVFLKVPLAYHKDEEVVQLFKEHCEMSTALAAEFDELCKGGVIGSRKAKFDSFVLFLLAKLEQVKKDRLAMLRRSIAAITGAVEGRVGGDQAARTLDSDKMRKVRNGLRMSATDLAKEDQEEAMLRVVYATVFVWLEEIGKPLKACGGLSPRRSTPTNSGPTRTASQSGASSARRTTLHRRCWPLPSSLCLSISAFIAKLRRTCCVKTQRLFR